jgi:hypothetical protein
LIAPPQLNQTGQYEMLTGGIGKSAEFGFSVIP